MFKAEGFLDCYIFIFKKSVENNGNILEKHI